MTKTLVKMNHLPSNQICSVCPNIDYSVAAQPTGCLPLRVHLLALRHVDTVFLQRRDRVLLVVLVVGALDGQIDHVGLLGGTGLSADGQNGGLSQWNHS